MFDLFFLKLFLIKHLFVFHFKGLAPYICNTYPYTLRFSMLYIGRILTGVGVGMSSLVVPVNVSYFLFLALFFILFHGSEKMHLTICPIPRQEPIVYPLCTFVLIKNRRENYNISIRNLFIFIYLRIFIQDSLFSSQGELLSMRVLRRRS